MRARLISDKITYSCGCAFGIIEGGHVGFAPCRQGCPNFAKAMKIINASNHTVRDLRDAALKAKGN